jgi:hypothetical protein
MGLFSSKKKKEEKANPVQDVVKAVAPEPKKSRA